jgi:DNA-binding response OmpR family regulator
MAQDSTLTGSDLRQAGTESSDNECAVYDDGLLRIEYDNYYVTCSGQRIVLPLKDFLLLSRLARNPERVVTAYDLWQYVWGVNEPVNGSTLRVHIYRLRQKLAPFGVTIESMARVGYRLSVNPSTEGRSAR